VVLSGNPPQVYAESILKACEFSVGSPSPSAAGVTGSDLKTRIVRIMTERAGLKLGFRKKFLLGAAALLAVAVPIVFGLANGPQQAGSSETSGAAGPAPAFEVASVKPDKPDKQEMGNHTAFIRMMDPPNDGRFYATGPTLRMLLLAAYGVQDSQIEGGPSWMDTESFDIQAKADDSVNARLKKLSPAEGLALKHRMLQALLTDRFKLTIKHETKNLPVYELVVAKNGPKIQPSKDNGSGPWGELGGIQFSDRPGASAQVRFQGASTSSIAQALGQQLAEPLLTRPDSRESTPSR
jgi:bla regulator protein BlaR1